MLLMVHAMVCLSISNGYMRPRLSLHPVPTRPSHPYRARYSREKATPTDVQGTRNENGNRDQTENDENGSNLCVLLLLCALYTSLRRLPNVPKALLTPLRLAAPNLSKYSKTPGAKITPLLPRQTSKQMPAFAARPQPPDALLLLPSVSVPCRKMKDPKKKKKKKELSSRCVDDDDDAR